MVPISTFMDIEEGVKDTCIASVTPVKSLKCLSEEDKYEFQFPIIEAIKFRINHDVAKPTHQSTIPKGPY